MASGLGFREHDVEDPLLGLGSGSTGLRVVETDLADPVRLRYEPEEASEVVWSEGRCAEGVETKSHVDVVTSA
jgi:hypothetical protein